MKDDSQEYHIIAGDLNERATIMGNVDGEDNPSFKDYLERGYGILNDGSPREHRRAGATLSSVL